MKYVRKLRSIVLPDRLVRPNLLFVCLIVFGFYLFSVQKQSVAQTDSSTKTEQTAGPKTVDELLDQWRSSSLGMFVVGEEPGKYVVNKVRTRLAADIAKIKKDDLLIKVGPIDLTTQTKADLQKYLRGLKPNSKISVVVSRQPDGDQNAPAKQHTLSLSTDSKAMLDGWIIAERMKSNRVITSHLEKTNQLSKLDTLQQSILDSVKDAPTPRLAYESINRHIDDLGVSHTAIIPKWGYDRLVNKIKGGIGLTIQRHVVDNSPGYFIVDMEPGGPAYQSQLKIGHEIISVNGIEISRSARLILAGEEQHHLLYMLKCSNDESLNIRFRATASGNKSEAILKPDPNLDANSATKSSIKVVQSGKHQFGYVRIWNLMSSQVNLDLRNALKKEFTDCSALIVDLRGRGGSIWVLQRVESTLKKSGKPIVVIIDHLSRSAKEILAARLKNSKNVRLVGEKTCGAVTAATFTALPSGHAIMYPVTSGAALSRYTNGVNLEGVGVEPHVKVSFTLPYLNGADPIFDAAKKEAAKMAIEFKKENAAKE